MGSYHHICVWSPGFSTVESLHEDASPVPWSAVGPTLLDFVLDLLEGAGMTLMRKERALEIKPTACLMTVTVRFCWALSRGGQYSEFSTCVNFLTLYNTHVSLLYLGLYIIDEETKPQSLSCWWVHRFGKSQNQDAHLGHLTPHPGPLYFWGVLAWFFFFFEI